MQTSALAATLSGTVTTPEGEPLQGVYVVAYDSALSNTQTTTDADGEYVVEGLPRGHYRLRAVPIDLNHVERYYPGAWSFCDGARLELESDDVVGDLDFQLVAGGALSGLLELDGVPEEGAQVVCRGEGIRSQGIVRSTTTDAEGRFSILGLDADSGDTEPYSLGFSAEGLPTQQLGGVYEDGDHVVLGRGDDLDVGVVPLLVGAGVEGMLEGFDGPVSAASVHLYSNGQVVTVSSDADGLYAAEGLPAGDLVGWASREGWAHTYWPDEAVPTQTTPIEEGELLVDYDLTMYEEAAITGVLDLEGDLSGVTLIAFNESNTVGLGTQADEDGYFRAGRLHAGRYSLFVYAEPEGYVQDYVSDEAGERVYYEVDYGEDTEVVVSLEQAGVAFGAVEDDQGFPVQGATVYLEPLDVDTDAKAATTDAEGLWRAEGLRPGVWFAEVFYTPYCDRDPGWVSVFWPGTVNPEVQTTVNIAAGVEFELDFTMPVDTDRDDMGDGWEDHWGLHVGRDDSAEDPDGDGVINLREYWEGTNPMEAEGRRCRGGCGPSGLFVGVWLLPLLFSRRR